MRLVIADTGPILYLLLIGRIELLPRLFHTVVIPDGVYNELCHPKAPAALLSWISSHPSWLKVIPSIPVNDPALRILGAGEAEAITLALSIHADLILMDERKGTAAALNKGFEVTGTLGVLRLAAQRGWIDIAEALASLKTTNFRYRQEMIDDLLREFTSGD